MSVEGGGLMLGRMGQAPKRRGEPVVRRVYEAALAELAERGFAGMSLPEVAARAGLHKTSVYRRWPTKEELLREALQASLHPPEEAPDSGELRADLLGVARGALRFVSSPLGASAVRALVAEGASPGVRAMAGALLAQQGGEGPRAVLARAVARGELPADLDADLLLTTVAGALMHRVLIEQSTVSEEQLVRLIDLVLFGVVRRAPP